MKRVCAMAAVLSLSAAAAAEDMDYSYVQASYSQVEFDSIGIDGDGFGVEGSYGIGDRFAVIAGYESGDLDFGADTTGFELGGLFHAPLSDNVDLVTTLSYVSVEIDVPGLGSADDDGYGVGVGLRGMASQKIELNGGVSYVDLSDSGDDTSFGAGIRYHFTEAVSGGLSGGWGDDTSAYGIDARFAFGN